MLHLDQTPLGSAASFGPDVDSLYSIPVDSAELLALIKVAKPKWTAADRKAVFAKLSRIHIRDSVNLAIALHGEGDQALNARLKSVGEKAFSSETLQAFKNAGMAMMQEAKASSVTVNLSSTAESWQRTAAFGMRSTNSASDHPVWEASAPRGWWRVIMTPCAWVYALPDVNSEKVGVHCTGKVLAMMGSKYQFGLNTFWLRLRDERDGTRSRQHWTLVDISEQATPDASNRYGVLLEPVAGKNETPSFEDRKSHELSVKAFRRTLEDEHRKLMSKLGKEGSHEPDGLLKHVRACYIASSSLGCCTHPYACPEILPTAFLNPELERTTERLLSEGYVIIDDCFAPHQIDELVSEVSRMDGAGQYDVADDFQPTSGQRDDRIVWVDHLSTAKFWPAISRSVSMLKAIAHALNPALSQHHHLRSSSGDVMYSSPLVPPATPDAVLTVPPKVMLATYPGKGSKYIPHTDSGYSAEKKSRTNPRELTAIIYANPRDWSMDPDGPLYDGGGLRIYPQSRGLLCCPEPSKENSVIVEPYGGRLVIFQSDLWHEVMHAWRERRALTLWIFRPTMDTS